MRRVGRWILIGLGVTLALIIVVIGAAFLVLRSGAANGWIEATVNKSLASPDQTITITGLSGGLPFDAHVQRIEIADRTGAWLRIDDAVLDLDAGALFGGTVRIETLSAGKIAMLRSPAPSTAPKAPPPP